MKISKLMLAISSFVLMIPFSAHSVTLSSFGCDWLIPPAYSESLEGSQYYELEYKMTPFTLTMNSTIFIDKRSKKEWIASMFDVNLYDRATHKDYVIENYKKYIVSGIHNLVTIIGQHQNDDILVLLNLSFDDLNYVLQDCTTLPDKVLSLYKTNDFSIENLNKEVEKLMKKGGSI